MATAIKRQIGTMDCLCCGHEIPVKASDNGTINAACAWCDFPAYAKAGTKAHQIITGRLKGGKPEPAPARAAPKPKPPTPTPAPEPEPAPAPRKRASFFDL